VSASTTPFATQGAVYRRPIDSDGPLQPLAGGMPQWTNGKADTGCIATQDATIALIDWSGRIYLSQDDGTSWSSPFEGLTIPAPSGIDLV